MLNRIKHFYINKYLVKPFSKNRYFISYDFKHKALWFRNYKVASRTIDHHLRQDAGYWDYIYSSAVDYLPWRYKDYFKFGFVRHPVQRFVSGWKDKVLNQNYFKFSPDEHERMKELSNFVEWVSHFDLYRCDEHLRLQTSLLDLDNLDFLGRFETFNEDFYQVTDRLNIEFDEHMRLNVTNSQSTIISEKDRSAIIELYQDDMINFYPSDL